MTLQIPTGDARRLTVRFVPLLAWLFIAAAIYGVASILTPALTGARPLSTGDAVAASLLIGMLLFVAVTGGQLAVCRIDRGRGLIGVTVYGLRGRQHQERPLREVTGLEVRILRRAQHRLLVTLRSGERLPLAPFYLVSVSGRGIGRIAAALGVEPEMIAERPPAPPRR